PGAPGVDLDALPADVPVPPGPVTMGTSTDPGACAHAGPPPTGARPALPAGPFTMGTSTDPWAYDNERPAHTVDLPAFRIDTTPVTNGAYAEFLADGGYDRPELWTEEGWAWRQEAGLESPQFWIRS